MLPYGVVAVQCAGGDIAAAVGDGELGVLFADIADLRWPLAGRLCRHCEVCWRSMAGEQLLGRR